MKEKYKAVILKWKEKFATYLKGMKYPKTIKVSLMNRNQEFLSLITYFIQLEKLNTWLEKKEVKLPLPHDKWPEVKGTFTMQPPSNVDFIGSFASNLLISKQDSIDLALVIPEVRLGILF